MSGGQQQKKGFLHRISDIFEPVKQSALPKAEPGDLGMWLAGSNTLMGRIEASRVMLEKLLGNSDPEQLINISETVVKAAAIAWGKARDNPVMAQVFTAWETIVDVSNDALDVYRNDLRLTEAKIAKLEERKATETDLEKIKWLDIQITSSKTTQEEQKLSTLRLLRKTVVFHAKIVYDLSFTDKDVAPQYLVELRQMIPQINNNNEFDKALIASFENKSKTEDGAE